MRSKESFNNAAKLYDEVRPGYPQEVVDWIIVKTGITINENLLEIAPGTGQATMSFAQKGYPIHAVELGDKLAEILKQKVQGFNVSVDISPFEKWKPNHHHYNMIYCATAFHWLDPAVKYQKCSDLLVHGGYLVLLWNHAIGTKNDIINQAYLELFKYYPDKPFSTKPKSKEELQEQFLSGKNDINNSGVFEVVDFLEHTWEIKQSKDKTIKGFYSQSSYLSLDHSSKTELTNNLEELFLDLDEEIDTEFLTTVYICKKK